MTGPDLIESGPARPPRRAGRRRLAGFAAALAVAAGAVTLAARADPDPAPAPPAATATPVPAPPGYPILDVAGDGTRVHLLTRRCPAASCGYRVLTWAAGRWTSAPLPAEPSTIPGRLVATERYVAVVDGSQLNGGYVDTGAGFVAFEDLADEELAAAPAGSPVDVDDGRVGVRDPRTAKFRPLVARPLPDAVSAVRYGRMLAAAARSGDRLLVATSTDAGRRWTTTAVATVPGAVPVVRLLASASRLWLVAAGPRADGRVGLVGAWSTTGTGGWAAAAPPGRLAAYTDAVATASGLLVTDRTGAAWLRPTGEVVPVAAAPNGLHPALLRPGPNGSALAITTDRKNVLWAADGGPAWQVAPLPP